MSLNISKCEIISNEISINAEILKDFLHFSPDGASILGSPLLQGTAMDEALSLKVSQLQAASDRLRLIEAHDALVLLKTSCSTSKLLYLLRSAPCVNHPSLPIFDGLLRSSLSEVCNVYLKDRNWAQATLPVSFGGVGIRSSVDLAPAAFLSSSVSTSAIQNDLLVRCVITPPNDHFLNLQAEWISVHGESQLPSEANMHSQKAWDAPNVSMALSALCASCDDKNAKARLLASASPHSGDWLHALPISSCGLRLDNEAVRVATALRLGVKVCEPHICPCGTGIDSFGTHAFSCKSNPSRIIRHNYINDIVARSLHRCETPSTKEPSGLFRSDGKRPDGITQIPWIGGKPVVWDVTVSDTLALSYISHTSSIAGSAAEMAASRKEIKYRELSRDYTFIPIAIESLGPYASKAASFVKEIGRRCTAITDDPRETSFLFQRISIAIQRFNALIMRGSFPIEESC